jgi:hypothetical protein
MNLAGRVLFLIQAPDRFESYLEPARLAIKPSKDNSRTLIRSLSFLSDNQDCVVMFSGAACECPLRRRATYRGQRTPAPGLSFHLRRSKDRLIKSLKLWELDFVVTS